MKFFFDDEISRCLEVNSPLQTIPFSLFWSKFSSEYKRIFVGPCLLCEITFFKEFWPSNLTKSPEFNASKGGDANANEA